MLLIHLCYHLGPWWHQSLGCCLGPCLGPWSYQRCGLHWCLWPMLPPETTLMSMVWAVTCSQVGLQGPCHSGGYADQSDLWSHTGPWCYLNQGCCPGSCLGLWPYYGSQSLSWCSWVLLLLRALQMPRVQTSPWSCCHQGHADLVSLLGHWDHGDVQPRCCQVSCLGQ